MYLVYRPEILCRRRVDISATVSTWQGEQDLSVKDCWNGHEWRERFSQWVQCSAQHVLALHATLVPPHFSLYSLPSTLSSTTNSAPSPTASYMSAIYPAPQYVDGDRGNRSTLCVRRVCLRNVAPSRPLAPPGDRWGDWIMWLISSEAR